MLDLSGLIDMHHSIFKMLINLVQNEHVNDTNASRNVFPSLLIYIPRGSIANFGERGRWGRCVTSVVSSYLSPVDVHKSALNASISINPRP